MTAVQPIAAVRTAPASIRSDRWLALLGLCGVLSALALIIATVVGGALREGYDPVRDAISELTEAGGPNAEWLRVFTTAYAALLIPFAYGLHRALPPARLGWVGPLLLGTAGLSMVPLGNYARCDTGCWEATTTRGQAHAWLVLVGVPLLFASMFAIWLRIRRHSEWRGYARHTLATLVLAVASGLIMLPFLQSDYEGLFERISTVIMLQWYVVLGLRLIALSHEDPGRGRDVAPASVAPREVS